MSSKPAVTQSATYAVIRENALILSLDKSETPIVARFDLDSLAQANFVVQQEAGMHRLSMRDFSGNTQTIADFSNKIDAHQALNHILQALVNHKLPKEQNPTSKAAQIFSALLKFLGIAFILLALYLAYGYIRLNQTMTPSVNPVSGTEQAAPMDGQAQDLDSLFTQPLVTDGR